MTAPSTPTKDTITGLFRRHLRAMRTYADEVEQVLGDTNPIVKRIRSCAASNERALDAVIERYKHERVAAYDWARLEG